MARPRVRPRGDQGASLPELLVTMVVFTIVLAALGGVVVSSLQSTRFATTKTSTLADARTATDAVSRTLRAAVTPRGEGAALIAATSSSVTFYASLDRGAGQTPERPTRVSYAYGTSNGRTCLTETQVPASDNTGADKAVRPLVWTTTGSTKCLAETTTPPRFDYYDTGRLTDPRTKAPLLPLALPTSGLVAADLPRVISVQVHLDVVAPGATDVPAASAQNRVALTNVISQLEAEGAA